MYPRECWPSRTTTMYQTSTIRCQQTALEYAMTQTLPRQERILVMTYHGLCHSQHSPNSANANHIHPDLQIFHQVDTTISMLYITVDGGSILDCQLEIGRGDELVILTSVPIPTLVYFTFSFLSKYCLLSNNERQASGFKHLLLFGGCSEDGQDDGRKAWKIPFLGNLWDQENCGQTHRTAIFFGPTNFTGPKHGAWGGTPDDLRAHSFHLHFSACYHRDSSAFLE